MAYNEFIADRIRRVLTHKNISFEEKKMMGGICFLVNDKMCVGLVKESLMARIDPDFHENALEKEFCREMDFTGRPMKGFVFVEAEGIDADPELEFWVQKCLDFNPKAKSSKKRK
jgi:TfoX/Sxy family transcriptional regulator of competence genes